MSGPSFEERSALLGELVVRAERTHPDLNEATTRLQFIDVLLFHALGWSREQCTTEEPLDGSYTDYSLGKPATQLVVEAKREGVYFNLPVGAGPLIVSLGTLTRGNEGLTRAVEQAHGYCVQRGVRLAAVTNGHQLIAFLGSREDGTPPMRGRAVAFRSLREMEDRFTDLWNFLSPDGIAEGNLQAVLRSEGRPLPPEKMSQRLWIYPGVKNRNEIEIELEILGGLFLQEIVSTNDADDDFLRECYLPSGALSQYALVSRDILRTRYHETVNRNQQQVLGATTSGGVGKELRDTVTERGVSRKPIVLLGDVGVGKTTFVRHLVRIDAKQELERSIVFYVDFGSRPALRRDLEPFAREAFTQQLIDDYDIDIFADEFVRAVYNAEINRFKKSVYKNLRETDPGRYFDEELKMLVSHTEIVETHLRRSLAHLRATQHRNAVVFFDNIDQRDLEFQDSVYLVAQSLADSWNVTTFVSLRPETFNASRRAGSLSAYQPRVFTISPPRIDRVIRKRLEFALSFDRRRPLQSGCRRYNRRQSAAARLHSGTYRLIRSKRIAKRMPRQYQPRKRAKSPRPASLLRRQRPRRHPEDHRSVSTDRSLYHSAT